MTPLTCVIVIIENNKPILSGIGLSMQKLRR